MSNVVTIDFMDLFSKPAYGHLATLMSDGGPQVSPFMGGLRRDISDDQ